MKANTLEELANKIAPDPDNNELMRSSGRIGGENVVEGTPLSC